MVAGVTRTIDCFRGKLSRQSERSLLMVGLSTQLREESDD